MALSRCPRSECNGSRFEMRELPITNSRYRHHAVQCSSCGAVVAVTDFLNIGDLVSRIAEKMGVRL